jgi:hypothetical protein
MTQRHFITTLIVVLTFSSCDMNYLDYYQHVDSPDGKYYYGLYSDISIGDHGCLVLVQKLAKEVLQMALKKW